jgi:hypothetical protein
MAATLFERIGRPPPQPQKMQEVSPAQKLLDWLQSWNKPTVCMREILNYGPYAIRDRERAIGSAQTLVEFGWLVPTKKHRRDMHKWQIVRRAIVRPTVNSDSRSNVAD